jgi:hypothetical protein
MFNFCVESNLMVQAVHLPRQHWSNDQRHHQRGRPPILDNYHQLVDVPSHPVMRWVVTFITEGG